ncbi:MAG: NAD(P)H-dependent oxidoreductase subunit E [Firmicutes bacterium]|jgi:NADH-quinone oxidoreductase subunit E|nr:NAD(P)H-dependent oxidoreductase subunit E [Bacillota bacterium]MBR0517338.1 NAD(P)H-dependent oxidoreductase subunit E [Bacillota bacterium]MBR4142226.1 NAD(P)H-dependent oxidoreductase subunit E [Bacillota bacterium]MCR4725095.1 NAD(P)H-dependent oxidoreductase subunit E [Clostridia bacterium]
MKQQLAKVEQIVESYDCEPSNLIAIMQEIQTEFNYLSEAALEKIAEMLEIPISRVYSVATFYENFSLEAKGEHIIKVCTGTACHVRKSEPIYNALREELKLTGKKKTSDDGKFTLETVACLGACGLAPVMTIDGEVHSKMTPEAAVALIDGIRRKEA